MPVVEYESGAAFPGVIGRTAEESTSGVARAACGPCQVRRTCSVSCWTTPATANLAATAVPSKRPTWTNLQNGGLRYNNMHTTALCSPSRACIYIYLFGTTTPTPWRASLRSLPAIPATIAHMPFKNGFLSEMLLQQGYNTYMIGKITHVARPSKSLPPVLTTALAVGVRL